VRKGPAFAGPLLAVTIVGVILESLELSPDELRARTGWELKPEGLCKADRCVPSADCRLPTADGGLDVPVLAERLGMALVHEKTHGLWALGPESGGRALGSAELPEISLPDRHGDPFSLSSLCGTKVLLVAWASW
jgi:hypothetical protein